MGVRAELQQQFIEAFNSQFQPPFTGSVAEWNHENTDLPDGFFSINGKFDISISNYLVAPMEDLLDPDVGQINFFGGVQIGKSLLWQLFLVYLIINNPGPTLILANKTDESSEDIINERIKPIFDNCKPVKKLLKDNKLKLSNDGVVLPMMPVKVSGAKERALHSRNVKYLVLDETWQYEKGAINKAKARTVAFGDNAKIIQTTQASTSDSEIYNEDTGLGYEWGWRCKDCGHLQVWHWSKELPSGSAGGHLNDEGTRYAGVNWTTYYKDEESGSYDFQRTGDSARLYCENCTGSIGQSPEERKYLNDTGGYVLIHDKGNHRVKSYYVSGLVNQKKALKDRVIQFLQAIVDKKKFGRDILKRDFTLQVLGEKWTPQLGIDQTKVLVQSFNPDDKWPDQIFKCLTVDYQKKLGVKFYTVVAFSRTEIRVVEHGYVLNWPDIKAIAKKHNIPAPAVGVDAGYNQSEVCLESYNAGEWFGKNRLGWTCLKGDDCDNGYNHKQPNGSNLIKYYSPMKKPVVEKDKFARLFEWANGPIKTTFHWIKEGKSTMKLVLPVPDPEFEKQLASETLQEVIDTKTGLKKQRWAKIIDDNHYLDCMCEAIVMAMMADKFGEEVKVEPPTTKPNENQK